MQTKDLQLKRAVCTILLILLLSVMGMTKMQAQNITFADANVKAICVANWDTNGDGELNQTEATAVTSLDGVFMFDDEITSFDELSFFTGLTSIGEDEFNSCTSLAAISIPKIVTSIGNYAFSDCSSLASITTYAFTPPALGSNVFDNVPSNVVVNVPCNTSALYQAANGWSSFFNYEEFIYDLCPISFTDANVKAICVAHWDSNGDGELSYAEAAAVTNLGTNFKSTAITSFDELEYFTSLTSIPNTAFYGCTNLASISLPSSVSALGNGSFYNCTSLATMTVYAEIPPTVGTNAFKNVPTNMMVHVPCGANDAYHNADGWSEIDNIKEYESCPIVFADANVKALCVANWDTDSDGEMSYAEAAAITDLGTVFRYKSNITSFDELQYFTGLTSIGSSAFEYCINLTSIKIPNSVTSFSWYAFKDCRSLTSLVIPNSVTTIFNYAFEGCSGLTTIELPHSVTSIWQLAFYNCSSLTSVEIPNSVVYIGQNPFIGCSALEQIIVEAGNTVYDSRENCNAIVKTNTNTLISGCKNTLIMNSVTSIEEYAFYGCSDMTTIEIPNSVTSIGNSAFYGCSGLITIEIPNSVTSIGNYAFYNCLGLTTIEIPNTIVSIGHATFSNCRGLIAIEIPNSVTSIGSQAFSSCTGLTSVVIPNSVTSIGNSAFWCCSGLTMIEIPNSITSIEGSTFSECTSLASVIIPNSVTSIGNSAFWCCNGLTTIVIPNSVTYIGNYAFNYCNGLTSMTILADNPPILGGEVFYYVNKSIPIYVPAGTVEAYQSASGWSEFTNYIDYGSPITFADANVKALCVANWDTNGDGELSYAEAAAVTYLGQVFRDNSAITTFDELQYFTGLTSIGSDAFEYCRGLISVTIPNSVTSIGYKAFYYCTGLTSIEIPNFVTSIGSDSFSSCSGLTSVTIPNSVTFIGTYAFYNCSSLSSIEIPNSVTTMGTNPFLDCSGLAQINVDSGNTVYDSREGCNAIIKTSTNELVTGCKNTVIPSSVTTIGSSAFRNCSGLTSIEIPNSITTIGSSAFSGCSGLTSIEIPNFVTSVGEYAFSSCNALRYISILPEVPPTIGNYAFSNDINTIPVYVPCEAVEAYQTTTGWNSFTNIMGMCSGEVAVTINPSEGGTVTGAGNYNGGDVCVLTATPNPGFSFGNWTENGMLVSMDSAFSFYAHPTTMVANFYSNSPITFADANVKALCVANWDTNGDGELSYAEAAVVTNLGDVFKNNSTITSFDELQYFTGLTFIGNDAFYYCGNLASIIIPNTVTYIGTCAFWYCNRLSVVAIPNSVSSIKSLAFGCSGITSIAIPATVTSIAYNAFIRTSNLGEIIVESSNTVYDSRNGCNAIIETSSNKLISGCKNTIIPNSVTSIGGDAFYWCTGLNVIEFPNSITSIGSRAFEGCSNLLEITIPNSVISLGYGVFQSCTSASSITIGSSLVEIGSYSFSGCSNVEQIEVDSQNIQFDSRGSCNAIIESSTNKLVAGCMNTIIPSSVTSIGDYAFDRMIHLISVVFPPSIISIGNSAFYGCSGLTSMIVLANDPPTLGDNAFYNVNKSIPVYVPCGTSNIYQNSEGWSEFTNYIEMCSGTITITASPTEGGTITGEGYYEGGATCTLTATANTGYAFINWTKDGEVVSDSELYNFYVAGDASFVANFAAIPPVPVIAEYYPDPDEPNSPYVKVHWAAVTSDIMIGDETSSTYTAYMPFYTLYNSSLSEALYTVDELAATGLTTAPITSLSWEAIDVTTTQPQNNISIWMANVSDTELTTTSHLASNMTLVYTGNIGIPPLGWNEFVFNEGSFAWDGTSNVLILVQRNNGQWSGHVYWRSHNPGFYGMAYKYQDNPPFDATTQTYTLNRSNTARPNIVIKAGGMNTYNLYRANCDGTGAQLIAENLNDTQYIDETWWQLENDSYKYGVSVADSTNTEIFWSNCIEKQGNVAVQATTLSQGWNWWSTYIEQNGPDGLTMMENSLGESGLTIKSQYAFVEYSGQTGTWMGGLASIDNASGYKVMVSEDCASVLSGDMAAAENHPTTLIPGWTWTGYPVAVAQTVTSALSDFEPVSGDIIKGQDAYASYSADLGWTPDNFMLNPGECYMYYSNATEVRNLIFSQGRGEVLQTSHEELYWKTDRYAYPDNLTMIATVTIDGEEQRGEDIELGAFVNGECRGSAKLYYAEPLDRYIAFLTMTGQDDEEVGFKLMNPVRDVTFTSEDHITFRSDAIVGHLDQPFIVHFGAMNGLAEMNTDMYIYPNPIDRNAPFTLVIPEEEIITEVLVVNAMGEVVSHKSGSITRTLHGLSTAGVYLVKVTCKSGRVYQNRLIVK